MMSITPDAYDSVEGILGYLNSLAELNELCRLRHEAGYCRHEFLHGFVIDHHWMTDSCGNFSLVKVTGIDPKRLNELPRVIQSSEVFKLLPGITMSHSINNNLPPANVTCFHCKELWTIRDAHDVHMRSNTEIIPLTDLIGKTLGEAHQFYRSKTDAVRFMQPDVQYRNDRMIDLTPVKEYPELTMNPRGWYPGREEKYDRDRKIQDDHIIEEGDEAFFNVYKYFHLNCQAKDLEVWYTEHFTEIFKNAGFEKFKLKAIANGYCPCESCGPWFIVTTPIGNWTVGWRKRVINIEWPSLKFDAESLFKDESVTKSNIMIHAYGKDKASEYINKIRLASPHVQDLEAPNE